jgi:C4-dicarboxylate transporter DctM subunit
MRQPPNPNPISQWVAPAARVATIACGWVVLAYAVALTLEILGRKFFNTSFKGIDELGGFVLAISAAIGASYAMAQRSHTRVDVFLVRFPRAVQRVLNTLAMVLFAGFASFAAWRGSIVLRDTLEYGSTATNLEQPLWIPQTLWLAGLVLLAAVSLAYAFHAGAAAGDASPRTQCLVWPDQRPGRAGGRTGRVASPQHRATAGSPIRPAMSDISLQAVALGFALLIVLMSLGLHVAFVMFILSLVGAVVYLGLPAALEYGTQYWSANNNFVLVSVPLFILLGELLVRGGFTDKMYSSLSDWLSPLPGGLLHSNIGASALFAAVSGSSVATAATIGTVALPAFRQRGYNTRLVLGTIAAGATLGILIPPSINMIIYGAMTNTSVGKLYAAGVLPGLLLTAMFMAIIVIACLWKPAYAGSSEPPSPLTDKLLRLLDLAPPLLVIALVMGSIYAGWATPTESAALGVVVSALLCAAYGRLSIRMLHESFVTTLSITSMIMLIAAAAFYLNFVLGMMGVPDMLTKFVVGLKASPGQIILILTLLYLILGCFLDALAMVVGTIPIVFPIVVALGIDPVWFGIFLVIMAELALITPPVGMNLYVVQGVRGEGNIIDVIYGVLPFLLMMLLLVALIWFFPVIALWLPGLLTP